MSEFSDFPSRGPCRTILLVFPEAAIRELVASNLRHAGLFPLAAASLAEGRRLAGEVRPDLAVIDLESPGAAQALFGDRPGAQPGEPPGESLLPPDVPVLVLASDLPDACGPQGGICGATRCLAKPFSPCTLVGEIVRQLRGPGRARPGAPPPLRIGPLEADAEGLRVILHRGERREAAAVSSVEMRLLRCLMEQPDRLLTREQIVEAVWGRGAAVDARTVDQNIRRLRKRIEPLGADRLIQTTPGFGYRFRAATPSADEAGR